METLICQRCNVEKPLEQFTRYTKAEARRRPFCKACHAAEEKWYRDQRREILGDDHPLLVPEPRQPRNPRPKTQEPAERTCIKCRITKPLEEFAWTDKHHRLHKRACKSCINAQQIVDRERRRAAAMQPRICVECHILKPAEEFHWRIKGQFMRQQKCKDCSAQYGALYKQEQKTLLGEEGMAAYHKERYEKTKERQLTYHKDYYQKNQERLQQQSRTYYANNKETMSQQVKKRRLLTKFGLTLEDFAAMLAAQNNVCAICGQNRGRLVVDHCHTTGRVRGLLCTPCNSFLGRIHDSIEALDTIKRYLLSCPEDLSFSA
jgi:hypothetical protein